MVSMYFIASGSKAEWWPSFLWVGNSMVYLVGGLMGERLLPTFCLGAKCILAWMLWSRVVAHPPWIRTVGPWEGEMTFLPWQWQGPGNYREMNPSIDDPDT